jgi:hypothetical protein
MKVLITRDSVAAGDDTHAPHSRVVRLSEGTIRDFVIELVKKYPLPHIAGGDATWVVSSGEPLAVLAQQWREPRPVCMSGTDTDELDQVDGVVGVHISYLEQLNPEIVEAAMRRLRLRVRR